MENLLVYSFRTNRHAEALKKAGVDVFVLGRLKEDMPKLVELIEEKRPGRVIGLAEVKAQSRFETVAINMFGIRGKVSKGGEKSYRLHVPAKRKFRVSKIPTRTFCNWAMYKIEEATAPHKFRHSFVHFNREDLPELISFITGGRGL